MIVTKKALPRRTFLRGMGAALSLPLLDAMIPAMTAAPAVAAPVKRLGFVYIPMGSNFARWAPRQTGALTELSPTLSPLMPYLNHLTVLGNIENKPAYSPGNHATANSGLRTGHHGGSACGETAGAGNAPALARTRHGSAHHGRELR